jgi:NAD(P)H-flavin reductase
MTIAVDASPELLSTLGQVSAVRDVSPDVVEVLIVPSSPVTILPGQCLKVAFDGFPVRAFCPTVCLQDPGRAGALHFHIRRVPGGRVSPALGHDIGSGHPVRLAGPFGAAYLQPGLTSRLVLVAEDTGFAPIWSIAAVALNEQPDRRIDLIVGSRGDDFYMQPALRWLAAYANVTITCVAASGQDPSSLSGSAAEHLPILSSDDVVHVAGSPSTVDAVMAYAAAAGAVCHAEAFEAAEAIAALGPLEARDTSAPPPSDSFLTAWKLRPRTFSRKFRPHRRAASSAKQEPEPGIRSRRGLDLYLAGSLVACSCLVLSTLVLVDPANTFGSTPGNPARFVERPTEPIATALALDPSPLVEKDLPDLSIQDAPQFEWDSPSMLASAADDLEFRLRSGAGDSVATSVDGTKDTGVAGVWAPDVRACPSVHNRKRLIPAVITADGASAGDTFCAFKKKKPTDSGLDVVASCSNANRQWTAKVRLTVNGKRLTWSSERGTQAYFRCEPNVRMAEAR